jgi:tRNA threonylcarbamoyladenosine biosynthesis protein TsaB
VALLLNIETSASICSVCISRDGKVVDFRQSDEPNSHARLLTVLIDELLTSSKLSFQQFDAIAISAGPGSYTGLRIGYSVAKGLCYALSKPLIAVPSLLALAEGIKQKAGENVLYMPVLDARRQDVYTAIYDKDGKEIFPTVCVTVDEELEKKISALGDIWIGGNAAQKCKAAFSSPNIFVAEDIDCDSRWMASIAEAKYHNRAFEDVAYCEPFYLKEWIPKLPSSPFPKP